MQGLARKMEKHRKLRSRTNISVLEGLVPDFSLSGNRGPITVAIVGR